VVRLEVPLSRRRTGLVFPSFFRRNLQAVVEYYKNQALVFFAGFWEGDLPWFLSLARHTSSL